MIRYAKEIFINSNGESLNNEASLRENKTALQHI